jgi:hypothetical protein
MKYSQCLIQCHHILISIPYTVLVKQFVFICSTDKCHTGVYCRLYEGLLLQSDNDHITVLPAGVLDIRDFSEALEGTYTCIASTATDFVEAEFRLTLKETCYLGNRMYNINYCTTFVKMENDET